MEISNMVTSCACMGARNGEPYCRCKMKNLGVIQKDGNWVIPEQIIGPVSPQTNTVSSSTGWAIYDIRNEK